MLTDHTNVTVKKKFVVLQNLLLDKGHFITGNCANFLWHKPSGGCTRRTEEGSCAAVRRRAK